jgi:DNA-binding PucR family transcriptional regulator
MVKEWKLSYDEAMHALEVAQGSSGKGVVAYEDLGVYGLLLHTRNPEELRKFGQRWLGPLLEYDERCQSELVATLKSYLVHDSNVHKTARAMSISINGLRYRLQRIQEIGQVDLDSSDVRFQLYLALQVLDMVGSGMATG